MINERENPRSSMRSLERPERLIAALIQARRTQCEARQRLESEFRINLCFASELSDTEGGGERSVRYPVDDLREWIDAQRKGGDGR
ncbi:MAG: hypothetical protein ACE5KM_13950 [Planctomycetaceae bacterium]